MSTATLRGVGPVDVRAPRFAAWVTSAVLAVVLLTASPWLLVAQAVVFALGARGSAPYALAFRRFIAPRLAPPSETEDPRPLRFAQSVGLGFAVAGSAALLAGATTLGLVLTAAALVAAFLNAAFGLCLGCEVYLLLQRTTRRSSPSTRQTTGAPATLDEGATT